MVKRRSIWLILLLLGLVIWWKLGQREDSSLKNKDEQKQAVTREKIEQSQKNNEIEIRSSQAQSAPKLATPEQPVITDLLPTHVVRQPSSGQISKKSIKKQNKITTKTVIAEMITEPEKKHTETPKPKLDTSHSVSAQASIAVPQSAAVQDSAIKPVVWQVEVNGLDGNNSNVVEVHLEQGHAWISQPDFGLLGLGHLLDTTSQTNSGELVDMSRYGVVKTDEPNGKLMLNLFSPYRKKTILDFNQAKKPTTPTEVINSSFLKYAFNQRYLTNTTDADDVKAYSTLLDFNTNKGALRFNYQTLQTDSNGQNSKWDRLSTRLVFDDLGNAVSYVVGDAYSNAGQNSNPVRFGGIQVAKDFSLQPDFLTQPKTDIDGIAASPSTLDVFIDNIKVRSSAVDAGPFSIQNLSGFSGSLARIIVKDELGNEKLILAPLFGGANILRKGLSQFAFQLGKQRPDYQRYEGDLTSGFYRYGLTDWLTAEVAAEYAGATQTQDRIEHKSANFALSTPIGNWSMSRRVGSGTQKRVGYDKIWRLTNISAISFNANRLVYSDDYQIIGGGVISNNESKNIQIDFSYQRWNATWLNSRTSSYKVDSVSLSHVLEGENQMTLGASLNRNVDRSTGNHDQSVSVYLSVPLGINRKTNRTKSMSASVNRTQNGEWAQNLAYQDSTTQALGYSYQINQKFSSNMQKSLSANLNYRAMSAEMGVGAGSSILRTSQDDLSRSTEIQGFLRGALVFAKDQIFLTQPIDNSFVWVDAGSPNVGVNINGKTTGRSNNQGKAVVAYNIFSLIDNQVSLDSETAPDRYNGNALSAVPLRQSGTAITFLYPSVVNLKIPNQTQGVLKVGDKYFPITDQGCFVELVPNSYQGQIDSGGAIRFVVPRVDSNADIPTVEAEIIEAHLP